MKRCLIAVIILHANFNIDKQTELTKTMDLGTSAIKHFYSYICVDLGRLPGEWDGSPPYKHPLITYWRMYGVSVCFPVSYIYNQKTIVGLKLNHSMTSALFFVPDHIGIIN